MTKRRVTFLLLVAIVPLLIGVGIAVFDVWRRM